MKYLLLVTVLSCNASESIKVYQPLTLKESAAKSFLRQTESQELEQAENYKLKGKEALQNDVWENNLPEDCKSIIARQYLKEHGYCRVNSLIGDEIFLWIYNDLKEEETTFFLGDLNFGPNGELRDMKDEINYYRPTRFSQNPFKKEDGSFAYTYQEFDIPGKLKDTITDTTYLTSPSCLGRNLFVGPSKQSLYAAIATNDTDLYVSVSCVSKADNPGFFFGRRYVHYNKGNQSFVSELSNLGLLDFEKLRDENYKTDYPTALTMDEETSYFYSGTASGKLNCYSSYTQITDLNGFYPKLIWMAYTFPTSLDTKIDDIELSTDSAYLWILSDNKLYCYDMRLNELNVKLIIPTIPSEHIEDETPESMCILRRGKDSRWWTLGGTKGTVLLADVEKGQCFILTSFNENKPIAEIWWKNNEVVLLNRAGKLRRGTVLIEYAEEFFQEIPVAEE